MNLDLHSGLEAYLRSAFRITGLWYFSKPEEHTKADGLKLRYLVHAICLKQVVAG